MGQGAQTTTQGQSPSWTPTAAMQAASQGQWNPQHSVAPVASPQDDSDNILSFLTRQTLHRGAQSIPDPMARAQEHFESARDQFLPMLREFQSLEGPERRAMAPEFRAARDEYAPVRDWYRDLQGMSPDDQTGMAAFGPPRPTPPPQMSPTMQVPNFPGMAPVSSVADLVAQMQARTANQTFNGGGGSGGGGDGGPDMVETPDGNMAPENWRDKWKRPPGWNGGDIGSRR